MKKYVITIVMQDGSRGRLRGQFASDWDALDAAMSGFYDARRISARREQRA